MTSTREHYLNLRKRAENESLWYVERIIAWADWGIMSRNTHDMAFALRNIADLTRENQHDSYKSGL